MSDQAPEPEAPPGAFSRGQLLAQRILPLFVALAVIAIVFNLAYGTAVVVGTSMLPNLRPADGLLITRGYHDPRRSDIVVMTIPSQSGGTEEAVKRVVGLPGDSVAIDHGIAVVNGVPEKGTPLVLNGAGPPVGSSPPLKVPPGMIYIMGDNRPVSFDSRYVGPQPLSAVKGRAVAVFMPIQRLRLLARASAR